MALSKKPINPEDNENNGKTWQSALTPEETVEQHQPNLNSESFKPPVKNMRDALNIPQPKLLQNDEEDEEVTSRLPSINKFQGRKLLQVNEGIAFDDEDPRATHEDTVDVSEVKRARMTTGSLTAEDVLTKDYNTYYARLTPKVSEIVQWTQKVLSDNDKNSEVSRARRERGELYEEMSAFIDNLLVKYFSNSNVVSPINQSYIIQATINEILGLGPLEPLWQDGRISEIMVNGPKNVMVEMGGTIRLAPGCQFRDSEHLLQVCQQILGDTGRRVDIQKPLADGSLRDGSRINVVHPIIAPSGPFLTIRRFPDTVFTLKELIEKNSMTEEMALEIGNLVYKGCSILISGGTGSGKSLDLKTLIPTPNGMTTMGDIKVGDYVLDENSEPTLVTNYFPQPLRTCYEVTFSDGTKVVADEEHNWFTSTRSARRAWSRQETVPKIRDAQRLRFGTDVELASVIKFYNTRPEFVSASDFGHINPRMVNVARRVIKNTGLVGVKDGTRVLYAAKDLIQNVLTHINLDNQDQRHKSEIESVVTTKQIFDTLKVNKGLHNNHAVRLISKPVSYSNQELLVSPYTFGAWLGDGYTQHGTVCGVDDEVFNNIVSEGNIIAKTSYDNGSSRNIPLRIDRIEGLKGNLSALGVLGGKFIPDAYLYSSVEQRRALIAGMLDTDGTVSKSTGCVQFANSNKALVDGFRQIIHSLGYQSTVTSKIPTYMYKGERKTGKRAYVVSFFTNDDVFRLNRKQAIHEEIRKLKQRGHRSDLRYIVNVQPVESVPMACITVDSPKSLYLATDAFVVTHNTSFLNALSGAVPNKDRVITIEDTLELRLNPKKHVLSMVTKDAAANGEGGISIRALVKNALRMRPDRLIIGEIRDESAFDMMTAMTTGHEGSMTTVHANDADGSITRVAGLIAMAGDYPIERALPLIAGGLDIIVSIARYEDGSRRVSTISEVPDTVIDTTLKTSLLWEFVQDGIKNDLIYGHYEKRNELSPEIIKKHRLDKKESLTLEKLFEISAIAKPNE